MESVIPVAVIGCGRMGRFHARVYAQLPGVKLVGVCDVSPERAAAVAGEFATEVLTPGQVAERSRAVTIAVPTQYHLETARPLLARGIACLIEKPLARTSVEARQIVELAAAGRAVVHVGHVERFNPALRAVEKLGLSPRFIEATRVSPMTFRSIDVGVVLDMMIHDIDIVLKLAGASVESVDAVGVSVMGSTEDMCSARVRFANGCVADLTASRLAMKSERRLRLFSPDAFVSVDFQKREGVIIEREGNLDAVRAAAGRVQRGEIDAASLNWASMVKSRPLEVVPADALQSQAEAFIAAVRDGTPPVVSAEHGLAAVDLAERIVKAIAPGSAV